MRKNPLMMMGEVVGLVGVGEETPNMMITKKLFMKI